MDIVTTVGQLMIGINVIRPVLHHYNILRLGQNKNRQNYAVVNVALLVIKTIGVSQLIDINGTTVAHQMQQHLTINDVLVSVVLRKNRTIPV